MTTTTPHPTARGLAEKAAEALVVKGAIRYPYAEPECATIILRETKLEALIKCVEAARAHVAEFEPSAIGQEKAFVAERRLILALRELDQTKV